MYRHILIPTDGSDLSKNVVEHGLALTKENNARATGIIVSMPYYIFASDGDVFPQDLYEQSTTVVANGRLAEFSRMASATGIPSNTIHVRYLQPYQAILDTAKNERCDLIVMATHGRRGISAIVLGSETVKVLTHSTVPVLVYR